MVWGAQTAKAWEKEMAIAKTLHIEVLQAEIKKREISKMKNMVTPTIWYHRTSSDIWKEIQEEGILYGRKNVIFRGHKIRRCTYLASKPEYTKNFGGNVLLKIKYVPNSNDDNYCYECWQMRVYKKIPLSDITIMENLDENEGDING